ncbi:MAG: type II toxin-antitoxin system YafQ family toxin [bacterium]
MKYEIQRTTQLKKDYKLSVKRGLNIDKLKSIIVKLASGESLPIENKDHNLINSNNYKPPHYSLPSYPSLALTRLQKLF